MCSYILHAVCMEGAHKSVQLHNIGSICMTALPTEMPLVLLLYSAARPDGFSSTVQPNPWQGTHPILV